MEQQLLQGLDYAANVVHNGQRRVSTVYTLYKCWIIRRTDSDGCLNSRHV
jgi:hypothetical protein